MISLGGLVSQDILDNPASCIFDSRLTMSVGKTVKVLGWYDNERWATSARRPLCWRWPPQAIPQSPYEFLTKVYPTLTHACEDNWQRNWQRNYESPRRGRGVHEGIDVGAERRMR